MSLEAWVSLVGGLIGGGAMGAVIKILYDKRQGGIQSILKRVKIFPLFDRTKAQGFDAVLKVKHESSEIEYGNIFVADVTVTNSGRSDFGEFDFGAEHPGADCIHAAWENPDQHHTLTLLEPVSPELPKPSVKLRARPFNRRDSYSFRLFLTSHQKKPDTPRLTSPHSIRFVDELPPQVYRRELGRYILIIAISLSISISSSKVYDFLRGDKESARLPPTESSFRAPGDGRNELQFSSTPPFPANYGHVLPGMKLSEIRATLPRGEVSPGYYAVQIDSGPFDSVSFTFTSSSEDPKIDAVVFHYRDKSARQAALRTILGRFGQIPHRSMALGSELVWPEINGFELTVSTAYIIRRASLDAAKTKGG